jgi:hypothetical protein
MKAGTFTGLSQRQGRTRKPHAARSPKGEHRTGEECERSAPLMPKEKNKLGAGWLALFANHPEPHGGECGVWGSAPGCWDVFLCCAALLAARDFSSLRSYCVMLNR